MRGQPIVDETMFRKPEDVAVHATVEFVGAHCTKPAKVLEIGCGKGDVAAALQQRGYDVTGIDPGPEELEATLAKGVRALAGHWPDVISPPVDVVLFTRSLHHIRDLRRAIEAVRRTLCGQRLLLIEDFDFVSVDRAGVEWLVEKVRNAETAGLRRNGVDEFATRIARATDPFAAWLTDEDIHPADSILAATKESFTVVLREEVPYLYRYLIPIIEETPRAAAWLHGVLEEERIHGREGNLRLIGRRIVAVAPP